MERATGTEVYGCGSSQSTDITLNIQTTTGGNFSISLNGKNTVEHLKKLVSKKLKVAKDRICLLHRERQLREGTLEDNGVLDGARVILLPSVETGLLSHRPENSVMQALESLNDSQVNDFLSGKSPLNLTMRLGDHMMLIQLQLSTLSANSSRTMRSGPRTSSTSCGQASLLSTKSRAKPVEDTPTSAPQPANPQKKTQDEGTSTETTEESTYTLQKKDLELLQNAFELYRTMAQEKNGEASSTTDDKPESADTTNCTISDISDTSENEQSPIKSLSNLVSSPINDDSSEGITGSVASNAELVNSVKNNLLEFISIQNKLHDEIVPSMRALMCEKPCQASTSTITPDSTLSDDSGDNFTDQSSFLTESTIDEYPMENLFNSAVDKGLFEEQDDATMDREISNLATTSHGSQEPNAGTLPSFQSINEPLKNKRFQYLLHKTSKFKHPIGQNKQKAFMQSVVDKHKKRMQNIQENTAQPSTSRTEPYITNSRKLILQPSTSQPDDAVPSTSKQATPFKAPDVPKKPPRASPTPPVIDTRALIEASKNLTQKLKKLSREVLTNKADHTKSPDISPARRSRAVGPGGAVIESMRHHGKGIYSGTFSGTLNPALQDRYGRPKRDISTIIHILNDLLCAAPPISLPSDTEQEEKEKLKLHITMGDHRLAKKKNTNTKESKNACTSTSDEPTKCLCCSQQMCSFGKCDGHLPLTSGDAAQSPCDHKDCPCTQEREDSACPLCALAGETCKKCDTAKTFAIDNSKTKCKLEQLRLVMQQKKKRREARKLKMMPYSNPHQTSPITADQTAINEEIETLA